MLAMTIGALREVDPRAVLAAEFVAFSVPSSPSSVAVRVSTLTVSPSFPVKIVPDLRPSYTSDMRAR